MRRRILIAAAMSAMLVATMPATADIVRLTAPEIKTLLAGNTITGTWSDTGYRQYFNTDGTTVYISDEGRVENGQWRLNTETNDYESWWRSTGWTPYAMVRTEAGEYAWVNGDRLEPFTVQAGRQIE